MKEVEASLGRVEERIKELPDCGMEIPAGILPTVDEAHAMANGGEAKPHPPP